jgi:hypothetical protein
VDNSLLRDRTCHPSTQPTAAKLVFFGMSKAEKKNHKQDGQDEQDKENE